MRLKNIDLIKGLLIFLVILGHILQGSLNDSIVRTIIYSFHMPLFIGISGFLFNTENIQNINFKTLISKYLFRIIIPWIIAVIFYFLFLSVQNDNFKIIELFNSFITPFYHLWFIPAFFSWVIITWLFKKIKINNELILTIAFIISTTFLILKNHPNIYQNNLKIVKIGIELVLHTFRPYFYFFFIIGTMLRKFESKKITVLEYFLPFIGFVINFYLFYYPNTTLSMFNFFIFNSLLISLILKLCINNLIRNNITIEWIGINSLAIYLWHMLPILISKIIIDTKNIELFYLTSIILEIVFIIIYHYLLKINILKKYVFGV